MSKVIQIVAMNGGELAALRDDGSIWETNGLHGWEQVPEVPIFCPQCESVKPQFLDTGLCQYCHADTDNGEG